MRKKMDASIKNAVVGTGSPIHPGQHVRDLILTPKKLSVVAAAKLVGVGRPALSSFLNGNVATTPEMASRVQVAFGVPAKQLLDMQAAFDAYETASKASPLNAMPYVVPFLSIKATDIETWVQRNIPARARLSVFLRTLVNSTNSGITKIDFPGNDNAESPGWDGYIESTKATAWIPDKISGWEFGTNQNIKEKADGDFTKSVKALTKEERNQITFVFVTPRYWSGKTDWIKRNKAKGQWKDVRAYDSSDLEQWLEQSIAAQTWFANETRQSSSGVRSLDICWEEWANITSPALVGSLFAPAVEGAKRTIASRLSSEPTKPIIIMADSTEEALAFLAQLFGPAGGELESYRDRILIFDEPGVLPKLAQGNKNFIAVAAKRQVERELELLARSMHTIVVYPRNAVNVSPDVILEPLSYDTFRLALEEMAYGRDEVTRYSNESGRSLTVLRRRLACLDATRSPEWAADREIGSSLIAFLFVGAWSSTNETDKAALTLLANVTSYEEMEKECQRLIRLNDSPLWSAGTHRGVISKIDLMFAIAGSITRKNLELYFDMAKMVLGEDDPKLDLPESDQWKASFYGKSREFSPSLRKGLAETLVLLAVHGNQLFKTRLGFDCENTVTYLVEELLTPLKTRVLEANDRDLMAYSEAAPDKFLSILEDDLESEHPESYGLMRPVNNSLFGNCHRTGLLWALEGLAWNPATLHRAALILAQLAEIEINDNWANKPIRSLESIFCAWMPQTAANQDKRVHVMRLLAEKFPMAAWKVCIAQIDSGQKMGSPNHKPIWRNDGHGFGEPFKTWGPILDFVSEMIEMALEWKSGHTREMLCDLIHYLHSLSEGHQSRVWDLVKAWTNADSSDNDRAFVREKIRVTIMSRRRATLQKKPHSLKLSSDAKEAYQYLEPSNILNKYEWLFRQPWVEESVDEIYDDDLDYRKREERITKLRTEALGKIYNARGLSGVFELAEMGKSSFQIGWLLVNEILPKENLISLFINALPFPSNNPSRGRKDLLIGALRALNDEAMRMKILEKIKVELPETDFLELLMLTPFRRSTWKMVDKLEVEYQERYWNEVSPDLMRDETEENNEAVERMLLSKRPRAAFSSIRFDLDTITPEVLFRLMSEMIKEGNDQPGQYQLERYSVEQAFALIDKNTDLTLEQKASLEFAYIDILSTGSRDDDKGYGTPNLEIYLQAHPELFSQAIVWAYRRNDEVDDPPEWRVNPEQLKYFAELGYKLLDGLSRIPGYNDLGELEAEKLSAWVKTVHDVCTELGRRDLADICIGRLLSNATVGKDSIWPCEPVRQVMEDVHSKNMMQGAHTGLYNSRGVTFRGEGGNQEREIAEKYRTWANALQYSHPFLASQLLMGLVKTYENEANREDTEAVINRRLR